MTSSNGNIFRVTGHLCGEVTGEFPAQRPVTRSFDVFFDQRPNKLLSKHSWGWWFETPSRPWWRHCNGLIWELISWLFSYGTMKHEPNRHFAEVFNCIFLNELLPWLRFHWNLFLVNTSALVQVIICHMVSLVLDQLKHRTAKNNRTLAVMIRRFTMRYRRNEYSGPYACQGPLKHYWISGMGN